MAPFSFFDAFSLLIIVLILLFWKRKAVFIFIILSFLAGMFRYQLAETEAANSQLHSLNNAAEEIIFSGQVVAEPDVRDTNTKLTIGRLEIVGDSSWQPEGKVLITTSRYPKYQYGDRLKIKGALESPQQFPDFNYKEYLMKDGIYSVSYYPNIELIESGQGNFIFSLIISFKSKLREAIYRNLSPPQSSILGAIILGDKRQIAEEWKEKLNLAGVRHLTAVSGMHVAVISAILMSFFVGLGLWRKQAFWISLALVFLFVVMTGLQSSAVRAGIMGGFLLLSRYLGRESASSRTIVIVAAFMLLLNPFLLRLDVGFQLSFLAMMGIIYLLSAFQKLLGNIPNIFQLRSIIAMTLSAQVFTLPVLIYNFGYFSLVSPLTNILIVPFLPFIMIFGFLFAVLGSIVQPLGWVLSFPSWFLLSYLTGIVDWFSNLPFSAVFFETSVWWLLILYLFLGLAIWRLRRRKELNVLEY